MKKEEFIEKYGVAAYEKLKTQTNAWTDVHPSKVKARSAEQCRKGGKRYVHMLDYNRTGLPRERNKIRMKHRYKWRPYKRIIAPKSQLHHQWRSGTAEYDGLALVEADQHMHGFINVIEILEGEITLFTEETVRRGNEV